MNTIPIESIVIGDRQRKDLGRIDELAASIQENGLIQPIVLDETNGLLAGRRRLEACKRLGWLEIPFVTLNDLSPLQKQIVEYEEDMRRKDRSWQEKCQACDKLFQLKQSEAAEDGESWTVRKMEDFTGVSKSNVNYMMQIARMMREKPDHPIAKAENYLAAIKLMIAENEREANAEMERRRQARPITPSNGQPAPVIKEAVEPDEVVIQLHGYNTKLAPVEECQAAICDGVFHDFQILAYCKIAVFWTAHRNFQAADGFPNHMPFPLIWNKLVVMPNGNWPFSPTYTIGIVASKEPMKENPLRQHSSVISCPDSTNGMFPNALVEHCVRAMSLDGQRILLPSMANPVAVAQMGRIPVWFEPDPVLYEQKLNNLKAYYEETIPNVRFV